MKTRQPFLPLGFGCIHWDTLSPEVRAKVLELWIQLLADRQRPESRREVF